MTLRAKKPILYNSKQYMPGDILPAYDKSMIEAWQEAGSAVMTDDEPKKAAKAMPASAQAGIEGLAVPNSGEDLAGHVPPKAGRGKKPATAKKPAKI